MQSAAGFNTMPDPVESDSSPARSNRWAVFACAALLIAFALTSWTAARTKSPTFDEPMHGFAAYVIRHHLDFTANPEDPPLWQWWAALPTRAGDVAVDFKMPAYKLGLGMEQNRWIWMYQSLMGTADEGDAVLLKDAPMLLLLGVGVGAIIAWWAWLLGGAIAALVATLLFACDPNFLAHASIVKNDVAITFASFVLAFSVWRLGRQVSVGSLCSTALSCAAVMTTKFSGPLFVIAMALTLIVRVAIPAPWPVMGRLVRSVLGKVALVVGVLALSGIVSYAAIWLVYGLRLRAIAMAGCGTWPWSCGRWRSARSSSVIPSSAT